MTGASQASRVLLARVASGACRLTPLSLAADDHPEEICRQLHAVIVGIEEDGRPVDEVAVMDRASVQGIRPEDVAEVLGSDLAGPSTSPVQLADDIRAAAAWRRMGARVQAASARWESIPVDQRAGMVSRMRDALADVASSSSVVEPTTIEQARAELWASIEDMRSGEEGAPTGFDQLDDAIGGLRRGTVITLAGPTGGGKSCMALQWARAAATRTRALYFSLEMSSGDCLARLCAQAHDDGVGILSRHVDAQRARRAIGRVGLPPIDFEARRLRLSDMLMSIRRWHERTGGLMVVCDHIGLVVPEKGHSRDREIAEIVESLKGLAMELRICVVAVCQFNRSSAAEKRRPELRDLRDSGTIEQISDVVAMIHRPEEEDPTRAELLLRKNRRGRVGTVKMIWHERRQLFLPQGRA